MLKQQKQILELLNQNINQTVNEYSTEKIRIEEIIRIEEAEKREKAEQAELYRK